MALEDYHSSREDSYSLYEQSERHLEVIGSLLEEDGERTESYPTAQAVLDSLKDTIAVLDSDGTILAVNEAWRRMARESCPPESLEWTGVGTNYLQVCRTAQGRGSEEAQDALKGIEAVIAGKQSSFSLEYPCFSPTQERWFMMHVTPLAQKRGAVVLHLDITEQKRQEQALREANSRFDVFLSMASHELKTPLAGISGYIQLALRRLGKMVHERGEEAHSLRYPLEQALQRVKVQDRMITELLDASRIRANRFSFVMRPCNLVEIVRRAVEDVQYLAPDRRIHISVPEVVPVLADADRIGQVVSNYLGNALKYSEINRPVELCVTRDSTMAKVSVKDEGPGLTPSEQELVWERFHRVRGVEVRYGSGGDLGLGLYLCRAIVERHNGHVGVDSVKGEGSTFWFTLPLVRDEDS